ncbi:MAG: FRG domain-containing protein [Pseudoruegeria sp.]
MKTIKAESISEIRQAVAKFDCGVLYRGQTTHYGTVDSPSAITSFGRNGCIPSEMMKWIRYSESTLRFHFGAELSSQEFCQAVLQHYGWHSFYLDASSSLAVSAWFASHRYESTQSLMMSEDHNESAVFLKSKKAQYATTSDTGHLYILDRARIEQDIGLIDLSDLSVDGKRLRFLVQSAFLIGPLGNKPLPAKYYLAHIVAPGSALRALAQEHALSSTTDLFPPPSDDPVLRSLLALPWYEQTGEDGISSPIPVFRRSIELPEYHDGYVKHLSPAVGLYRGYTIADRGEIDGIKTTNVLLKVPEIALFGTAHKLPMLFPKIEELLKQHNAVSFEVDTLIQHATQESTCLYGKGISVSLEDGLFHVGELMVEHPGPQVTGAGVNAGWYFERSEAGQWQRVSHQDECPCGDEFTHTRHLSMLTIIEEWLRDPSGF